MGSGLSTGSGEGSLAFPLYLAVAAVFTDYEWTHSPVHLVRDFLLELELTTWQGIIGIKAICPMCTDKGLASRVYRNSSNSLGDELDSGDLDTATSLSVALHSLPLELQRHFSR